MDALICGVKCNVIYRCTEFGLPLVGGFGEDSLANCVESRSFILEGGADMVI